MTLGEKKFPVYLCELDWKAIQRCILGHIAKGTMDGHMVWQCGRDRIQFINEQIELSVQREYKRLDALETAGGE